MMHSNQIHAQPQRFLSKYHASSSSSFIFRVARSCTTPNGFFCQAQRNNGGSYYCRSDPSPPSSSFPHNIRLVSTTSWPEDVVASSKQRGHSSSTKHQWRCLFRRRHQTRLSSHYAFSTPTATISPLADIEYRVRELERNSANTTTHNNTTTTLRRLTNLDIQHEIWPLLAHCSSIPTTTKTTTTTTSSIPSYYKSSSSKQLVLQDQSLIKARLCNRILDLCLNEVEGRRVFLWDWLLLQQTSANTTTTTLPSTTNDNNNNNDIDKDNFSPTKFWNDAPHPTKQMFNLVLSSWKNVIESTSHNSIIQDNKNHNEHNNNHDAMELMEYAAKQASSLLLRMEEEYVSDVAFISEYNSRIDRGRFTSLLVRAAVPDVRNYTEVIGAWGQCIDGSVLRLVDDEKRQRQKQQQQRRRHRRGGGDGGGGDDYRSKSNPILLLRDGALQKRLRLEASSMKAMMELLESMEEDLYGTFGSSSSCSETTTTTTNIHYALPVQRKKPPPDRVCYNIILASMARQLNPSLYEMRLVLQRMMERVKFELESQGDDENDEDNYSHAMSFFPDVVSYNALIEARANRAAMFTTEEHSITNSRFDTMQQQQQQQLTSPSRWRQQLLNSEVPQQLTKSRFTSSEEEAILAEQTLEEMNNIATVSVRPNIWSYNAVIKAWIKCGTERGLHRSVLLLRSLALNGINSKETTNVNNDGVFERIARWGASLLSNDDSSSGVHAEENRTENNVKRRTKSKTIDRNVNAPQFAGVGMANRLNYLAQETPPTKTAQCNTDQISVGMHSRMLMMSSALQPNNFVAKSSGSLDDEATDEKRGLDPIGPLPFIESNVLPDMNTFRLVINAMERRGTITSAKLAEDLLHLLEAYYFELTPTTAIYNSVLNAWSQAGKIRNDAKVSFYAADRASALLDQMLDEERQLGGILPPPNEASFLMVINAMAHAADSALNAGNISDAEIAATNAENILQKMELQPLETRQIALSCRGGVVRIWASLSGMSGSRGGYAARAQTLLMKMVEEAGHLPIDSIYFNVVLDAWARDLSRKDMDQVMSRLSMSRALLVDLIEGKYNATPDSSSFNHVIRACYAPWASRQNVGEDVDRRNAWETAFDIYSRMTERRHGACRPDAHTYTHMFKALACLWPRSTAESSDERVALCRNIFQSCCKEGQLTKTSFWVLSTALESSEFMDLLAHELRDQDVTKQLDRNPDNLYAQMPAEWSRNGRSYKSLNRHKH